MKHSCYIHTMRVTDSAKEVHMHLTPRELDKLMIHTLADVALKRKAKGLKLNHPETVAVLSAAALEEARAGKTVEEVMAETRKVLTRNDVMEGVVEMIPTVQVEAVFTDGSRLITFTTPSTKGGFSHDQQDSEQDKNAGRRPDPWFRSH